MLFFESKHFGRYFFCRMMDKGIACSVQPSHAILIQLVYVDEDPMTCEIPFDVLHHFLDTTFALRILFPAHADLKAAMTNRYRKFVSQNEIPLIFADEQ